MWAWPDTLLPVSALRTREFASAVEVPDVLGFAGPLRIVFEMMRTTMVRRYLAAYRSARPFRDSNTAYYEALRVLSALVSAGEYPPGPRNPWHKPRVLAALYRHFETVSGVKIEV